MRSHISWSRPLAETRETDVRVDPLGATLPSVKISGQNLGRVRNVRLIKDGSQPILATIVQHAQTEIICQFQIPAGAATGDWDLVVDEGEGAERQRRKRPSKLVDAGARPSACRCA